MPDTSNNDGSESEPQDPNRLGDNPDNSDELDSIYN